MSYFNSFVLGVVQGLTEFLPISSSGHLVLIQKLLPGFSQPGILFDVILHLGTLFAVVFYFRKKLIETTIKNFWFIVTATIPAAIIGVFFDNYFEALYTLILYVGFEFLVNAAMSFYVAKSKEKGTKLNIKNSFLIGIAQAIAISPGISRSGSTIFAGSILGINKEEAAQFSFIISLPAVAGAILLQLFKYGGSVTNDFPQYIFGALVAFVFGLIAIKTVMNFVKKGKFKIFALYSLIMGLLVILLTI